ncbi:unnamed protein product [Clavelina lepadiformis]|uniref:Homeobox domain-containing protein n=1 Tax=Clavelina lepadiformis TaxID=159417 RepID=A0ABP0FW22_CLALP
MEESHEGESANTCKKKAVEEMLPQDNYAHVGLPNFFIETILSRFPSTKRNSSNKSCSYTFSAPNFENGQKLSFYAQNADSTYIENKPDSCTTKKIWNPFFERTESSDGFGFHKSQQYSHHKTGMKMGSFELNSYANCVQEWRQKLKNSVLNSNICHDFSYEKVFSPVDIPLLMKTTSTIGQKDDSSISWSYVKNPCDSENDFHAKYKVKKSVFTKRKPLENSPISQLNKLSKNFTTTQSKRKSFRKKCSTPQSTTMPEKSSMSSNAITTQAQRSDSIVADSSHNPTRQDKMWPAWVYCTRYSDRPSAGPRARRRKNKAKDDTKARVNRGEKRARTAFSGSQLELLQKEFEKSQYLTEEKRVRLANNLGLSVAQIKVWFQNKRAKVKKNSGVRNVLALQLIAQGLYNHRTLNDR